MPRLRRRLGIVFQDFRLLEDRTAAENIAFALEVTGARRDTIAARVMRVLTQVGLAAKSRAYPRELSGGEQQRVAIARALVNDPAILLADEPTGNLDERATRGVFQLLRDINAGGTVVVMATHDLDLVRQTPLPHHRDARGQRGVRQRRRTRPTRRRRAVKLLTREALLSFRRAPLLSALSITTIAFSLFTLGLFGLVAINLRAGAPRPRGAGRDRRRSCSGARPPRRSRSPPRTSRRFPRCRTSSYVTEEQALARARSELVEFRDAYRDLQVNPLPASIEVRLKDGYRDAAHVERVAAAAPGLRLRRRRALRAGVGAEARPPPQHHRHGRAGDRAGVRRGGGGDHRRHHPAHPAPARPRDLHHAAGRAPPTGSSAGPFLLEGALKGLLGGLLSLVLCYAGYLLFRDQSGGTLRRSDLLPARCRWWCIVVFGVLLGLGGSLVSVGRHLRHV